MSEEFEEVNPHTYDTTKRKTGGVLNHGPERGAGMRCDA
jgi:hypothetical protein